MRTLLVSGAVTAALLLAPNAFAANEYQCGEGGKPDADKKVCSCPSGKAESTDKKGVSRCVPVKAATPTKPPTLIRPSAKCPEGSESIDDVCVKKAVCPAGTVAVGDQCLKHVDCPAGTVQVGEACVAEVVCPPGFHFESPRGCIGDLAVEGGGGTVGAGGAVSGGPAPPAFVSKYQGPCPSGMALVSKDPVSGSLGLRFGFAIVVGGFALGSLRRRRLGALASISALLVGCPHTDAPGSHTAEAPKGSGVCLDVTEVTVRQYASCVAAGKCAEPTRGGYCNYGAAGHLDHPVNCVDYAMADSYCEWQGRRLPTEDEWQWAAQGGSRNTKWPWGEAEASDQGCWARGGGTCAVGSKPSGDDAWGVKDLAGNVAEWTSSRWGEGSSSRVIRGGGWNTTDTVMLQSSHRESLAAEEKNSNVGFRCAKSP